MCKDAGARTWARMGSCVRCCWAGLLCCHGTVLCRGGGALGSSGARMHAEGLNRVGRTVYGCVYLCTQSALGRTGFRRHRRRDRRACCRCGRPGLPRAQEGQSKIFEDGKCVGSGGALRQTKGHCCFNTSSFTWTLQLFVAGLSVGSAPVLFIGRGRHGRIRHQPDLTWVCWWRQVTEEEVHLCRAVAAGHYFFFFRRCGGRQHRGEGAGGWHSAVNFRDDARRRDVLLGYAPHALPITCGRRAAVEGREGSGRLRCMAVLPPSLI